ncbi:Maf family nucleotide pyrophosphatase [Betaproteobacteria bacterium]|nr:Maf family nucleotide pyrophosphatase [Betaproteobacteria bacterium]
MRLILASSSKTRKTLLHRICGNSFEIIPPEIDETPLNLEDPKNLSERLSLEKALKISKLNQDAIVIGSDQVAFCDGKILKKSNNLEDAFKQISWQVGKQTTFFTGLVLARHGGKEVQSGIITSHVFYRDSHFISENLVRNYVKKEKPLNCAGSTKFESLGICFLKRIETEDPSALMGLPLIKLCCFLKKWNVRPFA